MAFTMQSFVLVSDSDEEGPIFQVADFDVSRLCGSALCPGAVELSAVPPELMTIKVRRGWAAAGGPTMPSPPHVGT
jgi:hypothetical protein